MDEIVGTRREVVVSIIIDSNSRRSNSHRKGIEAIVCGRECKAI